MRLCGVLGCTQSCDQRRRARADVGNLAFVTDTQKTPKKSAGFTADERAAMKERAKELKSAALAADGEADVLAKIAEMPDADRDLATQLHELIKAHAPSLAAKTWYGMPAYAKDGTVVCFFQSAHRFKTRYATLGFSDAANLDDGTMWPTVFALKEFTAANATSIAALLTQAVSGGQR